MLLAITCRIHGNVFHQNAPRKSQLFSCGEDALTAFAETERDDHVLDAAKQLSAQLHEGEVEINFGTPDHPPGMYQAVVPLDLLAAALREPCEGTKLLQAAGITEEKVLQTIRASGDLEKGSSSQTQ